MFLQPQFSSQQAPQGPDFQRWLSYFPRIISQRADHPTKADHTSLSPSVNASSCFIFAPITKKCLNM